MKTESITLNNGMKIPIIGLGTSRIVDPEQVVYYSIKNGVRMIDTAPKYGNEEEIGKGIKKALDEGICKREDLIIIGKVWIQDRNDPEQALKNSLSKLQLDYIDIYLDHWPSAKSYGSEYSLKMASIYDFWPKMENLVKKELAKSIGVSNYNIQCLCNLLSFCQTKPVVNEVEFHLFYIQNSLKEFCLKQGINVISYYPMPRGNGAKEIIKTNPEYDILEDKLIKDLALKYNKTRGQIILNWHHLMGVIPIPSTSKLDRMEENLGSFDFKLTKEELEKLSNHFEKQTSLRKFCGCKRFFGVNVLA